MSINNSLIIHFTFDDLDEKCVIDSSVSKLKAILVNNSRIEKMGKYHVLNLGNSNGYLDLTSDAGKLIQHLNDFSISIYYRVDKTSTLSGNGYFLWSFSKHETNSQTDGPYHGYRLNSQRIATSTGGWSNETGIEVNKESNKERWINVIYVQRKGIGKLFIDGKLINEQNNFPIFDNIFNDPPNFNWIGRPPFNNDFYLQNTLITDFRVYSRALDDFEVKSLSSVTTDLEHEFIYGTPGNFAALKIEIQKVENFIKNGLSAGLLQNALDEVQDEVNLAKKAADEGKISQKIIDNHVEKMKNAVQNAEKTKGIIFCSPTSLPKIDHGFVHPGGLHNQDDFDRVKNLLAKGDETIKNAWNVLITNRYSQSNSQTWPVETIIRGGKSGQNYMNVCRGASIAYQNALRWKIDGNKENADCSIRVLMAWARGNKYVSGDTNMSLAAGLTGYQFAQAAELMRDYEGWKREEFEEFKKYMLVTWYPVSCTFLRSRHDTWLNWRNRGKGQRPGHYWSNWGLCNVLFLMILGVLCDDVFIYNQGISFYKNDHVGTFKDRSKETVIVNDGCNEFIGNLIPVVLPDKRGPFGFLGQMQESGRDQGHALLALGLAVDICKVALIQGDDLFAYMNDRLAAGIEYVAAFNFSGVDGKDLPWINYNYSDCRGRLYQGWLQEGPNPGGIGGWRPYWDRIIGYYEGIRGVKMQFSEMAAKIVRGPGKADGGGGHYGENSGGFDHLGFTTLMDYRPSFAEAKKKPVLLSGSIFYKGSKLDQTNLGGLNYNFEVVKTKAIPPGEIITLIPNLPDGIKDNGSWKWSTGETTKDIVVTVNRSFIYRVNYTADNGIVSTQSFSIAVAGDCSPDFMRPEITVDGKIYKETEKTVEFGENVILYAGNSSGWTDDYIWSNGVKNNLIVIPNITEDRDYFVNYTNQGGNIVQTNFQLKIKK